MMRRRTLILLALLSCVVSSGAEICNDLITLMMDRYAIDISHLRPEIDAMATRIAKGDRIPADALKPLVEEVVQAFYSARRVIDDPALEGDLLRGIFNGAETAEDLRLAARILRGQGYNDFELRHFAARTAYFSRRYDEFLHDRRATSANLELEARQAARGRTVRIFDGTMREDRSLAYDPATGRVSRIPLREASRQRLRELGLRLTNGTDPIPFNDGRDYPDAWIDALDAFERRAARSLVEGDRSFRIAAIGAGTQTLMRNGRYEIFTRTNTVPRPGEREAQYQLEPKACDVVAFRDAPGIAGRRELCLYEMKSDRQVEDSTIEQATSQLLSTVSDLVRQNSSLLVGDLQIVIPGKSKRKLRDYRLGARPVAGETNVYRLYNAEGRPLGVRVNGQFRPFTVRLVP